MINDKEQMVRAIIQKNIHKYHQTELTGPFLKEPLQETSGDYGETSAPEQVSDGTFNCPVELDNYIKDFIQACARSEEDKRVNFDRTPGDFN